MNLVRTSAVKKISKEYRVYRYAASATIAKSTLKSTHRHTNTNAFVRIDCTNSFIH